jgi:outer membrane protein OmpA-like peptidoglycan-associated protein
LVDADLSERDAWPVVLVTLTSALLIVWLLHVIAAPKAPPPSPPPPPAAVVPAPPPPAVPEWAALGEPMTISLADGTQLSAPTLGVERRLVKFLNDASARPDRNTWFDFDRLLFDTNQATLQSASDEQVGNVAAILKAYKSVTVRLGGYTDSTGDPKANLALSEARAQNVMAALVKLGVAPERMSAQGYGATHPVADNATEEGRQKNRRISLRVLTK